MFLGCRERIRPQGRAPAVGPGKYGGCSLEKRTVVMEDTGRAVRKGGVVTTDLAELLRGRKQTNLNEKQFILN